MWTHFKAFLAHPYSSEDMNAWDWFMFLGLLIVLITLWGIILRHITEAV